MSNQQNDIILEHQREMQDELREDIRINGLKAVIEKLEKTRPEDEVLRLLGQYYLKEKLWDWLKNTLGRKFGG